MDNLTYRQDGRSDDAFAKSLSSGEKRAAEFEDMFRSMIENVCSHPLFINICFSDFGRDFKHGKGVFKDNIVDAGDFCFSVNNISLPIEVQCVPDILASGKINPAIDKHFKLKADVIPRCLRDGIGLFWVRPILDSHKKRNGFRVRLLNRSELISLQKSEPTETISCNSNKKSYKILVNDYPDRWIDLKSGGVSDTIGVRNLIRHLISDKECSLLGI